jgi:hypothetical protein
MKITMILTLLFCAYGFSQNSKGTIIDNTNMALPSSYKFKEYVFAEPNDQGICNGTSNSTAKIVEVFLAQTHRKTIDHPFFFLIGHRPALFQVAITGVGAAPDVQIQGFSGGQSLGKLCLSGPSELKTTMDLSTPDFENYFSVTLPKSWVKNGLELEVTAGSAIRRLASKDLKIGPYAEMNLVMVNMDVLNYNEDPHDNPIFKTFLEEVASAIPASVIRFGVFPETLKFPELVASRNKEQLLRIKTVDEIFEKGIEDEGNINSVASVFLENLHKSTGDYISTVYFGNTLNLAPGGWGGGKAFVGPDYTDIFIHELGHALSLPHWGEAYRPAELDEDTYSYPYGGELNDGGGRGEAWNFIQETYEFEAPICSDDTNGEKIVERSDAMQREFNCLNNRASGLGPWDGFGDFSALAMYRYLSGAKVKSGEVDYKGNKVPYQFSYQDGFPTAVLDNGKRTYVRDVLQPNHTANDNIIKLPGEELLEQNVYLVYGSAHKSQEQANIIYEPIKFKGTLLPIIDPTNPETFEVLKKLNRDEAPEFYGQSRDITLKLTYEDGSILHAIVPFATTERGINDDFSIWRRDVTNFSLIVPGEKKLCGVEVFERPFVVFDDEELTAGNINLASFNITAQNFMNEARSLATYGCEQGKEELQSSNGESMFYPNPFNESFTVSIENEPGDTLSIFNLLGQMVSKQKLDNSQSIIQTTSIASGMYLAVVKSKNGAVKSMEKLIRK